MQGMQVQSLGWQDAWEGEMATHSSILAWEIPWTEETGRLQSMGSPRVGHGLATEHTRTSITIDSMMEGAQGTKIWQKTEAEMPFLFLASSSTYKCHCAQSRLPLCDPMNCYLPGSAVHGIFQARILEWAAISFSRGIFLTQGLNPCFLHCRPILPCWVTGEAHEGSKYCLF